MAFVQGPDKYLTELGISVKCVVDPSRTAVLNATHRAFVNYEAYYFCDQANMSKFDAAPYRYTGKVTDPVTRERFQPTADSPHRSYGGRLFYFASAETATTFDADQMKYGTLMTGMREKAAPK
jgi:YHS domain-containing protein